MHPRITRFYANNYRCFVNFELRPERRCLLLGYNGSGKSSVFDVIEAVRALVVLDAEVKSAFRTGTLCRFLRSSEQRFELDIETERGTLRYALHIEHNPQKETASIVSEQLSLDDKPLYRLADAQVELFGDGDGQPRGPFPFSPQRSFLGSYDPRGTDSLISRFKSFMALCWTLRVEPGRIGATAREEDAWLSRDGTNFPSFLRQMLQEFPDRMQLARDALREIMPGFLHLRAQSAGRAKVIVATFEYPGGPPYDIDFDALSDGQKTLIVLYVVLHGIAPHLPAICIDEPDNFVSIREIQSFLTELANVSDETGLQVIMISHSPEVIDYAGASGAVLLERPDGGHTRVGQLPSDGALPLSELMARGWLPGGSDAAA